jgi:hypothetical protein
MGVGRAAAVPGGRKNMVGVRFSDAELAELEAHRGAKSASQELRDVYLAAIRAKKGHSSPDQT